jgi:hypothetical protein
LDGAVSHVRKRVNQAQWQLVRILLGLLSRCDSLTPRNPKANSSEDIRIQ